MIKKYRHELKFLCTYANLLMIENKIRLIMKPDSHAGADGTYLIRSVYFDDIYRTCFHDNENGIDPRVKYRIRIYNNLTDTISLEKKVKKNGMTGKETVSLTESECNSLIKGKVVSLEKESTFSREFNNLWQTQFLRPKVLIEYRRKPYIYSVGNVRVTFDMDISASLKTDSLFEPNLPRFSLLPTGRHILEVKYDDFLPDFIAEIISDGHINRTTFSKFYLGCKAVEGRI